MNEPETIRQILENSKTIAVVGLSGDPARPSFAVAQYMQNHGYRILPVNPAIVSSLGEQAYPTLEAACARHIKVDLVDVFRAPEYVPDIVEEVIRLKVPYLWLQEGVCHLQAAERAEAAGIGVVMDRCLFKEHARHAAAGARPSRASILTERE